MKLWIKRRHLLTLFVIFANPLAGIARSQEFVVTPTTPALVNALDVGGLPAAAALVQQYRTLVDILPMNVATDFYSLSTQSDAVLFARVTSTLSSQLSSDSRSVTTDFELLVLERFQGSIADGEKVRVRLPGGLVRFDNGTTAEWRLAHMPQLRSGDQVVVFLRRTPDDGNGIFQLVSVQQGVYTFDYEGRVASTTGSNSGLAKKLRGVSREEFLGQIRASTFR